MSQVKVEKPTEEVLKKLKVSNWTPWSFGIYSFDWFYSDQEKCYIKEGRVMIKTADGDVEIKKGDLVTFPKGLCCTWQVLEPIEKVSRFG